MRQLKNFLSEVLQMDAMYKRGDKVLVRQNLAELDIDLISNGISTPSIATPMEHLAGRVVTIRDVRDSYYGSDKHIYNIKESGFNWICDYFEPSLPEIEYVASEEQISNLFE